MEVRAPRSHACGASPVSALSLHVTTTFLFIISLHGAVAQVGSNAGCTFQSCGEGWSCYAPTINSVSSGQHYWSGCSLAYSYVPDRKCNYQPCLNQCTSNDNGCLSTCAPYITCKQSRSTCETDCYSAYYSVDMGSYEECLFNCYDEYYCDNDCGCDTQYYTCNNVCYSECHTEDNMLWWNSNCTTHHVPCIDFNTTSITIGGNAAGQFLDGTYDAVNVLGTAIVNFSTNTIVSTVNLQSTGNCTVSSQSQVDTILVERYDVIINVQSNGYVGILNASNYNPLIHVAGTVAQLLFSGPLMVKDTGYVGQYQQYGGNLTYTQVSSIDYYEQTNGNATFIGIFTIGDYYELNSGNALYVGNGTFNSFNQTGGTATFIGNMQIGRAYSQAGGNATFNGDVEFVWGYDQNGGTALFTGNVNSKDGGYSQEGGTALFTGSVTMYSYGQAGGNATFAGNGTIEEFTSYGGNTVVSGAMIIGEYELEDSGGIVVFGNRSRVAWLTSWHGGTFFIAGNINTATIEFGYSIFMVTSPGIVQSLDAVICDVTIHLASGTSIGTLGVGSSNFHIIGELAANNGAVATVGQYQQAASSMLTLEGTVHVGNISGTGTFMVGAASTVLGQMTLLSASTVNNTVVVSPGAFVNNLTGVGNITIGGSVISVYITYGISQNTTLALIGTANVTSITANNTRGTIISVGPLATVSTITSSTFGPTTTIDGVVLQSTSTNSTISVTVRTGGVLRSHCQYGGTLALSNNAGTVSSVCGYGTFFIQNGTVFSLFTSTSSTGSSAGSRNSTVYITLSDGASISTLSVNSSTTVLYLSGGFVEKIVLLSAVRSMTIVISDPNSSFGELHSMFDIDTLTILSSSSNVVIGPLYVSGGASICCRNVLFRSETQPLLTIVAPLNATNVSIVALTIDTSSQLTVSNVPVVLVGADSDILLLNFSDMIIAANNSSSIVHVANVRIGQLQFTFENITISATNTLLFLADGPRTFIGATAGGEQLSIGFLGACRSSLLQLIRVKVTSEGAQQGPNTEQYALISLVDGSFRNMLIAITNCNVTVTSLRSVLYVGGNMQLGHIAFTFSTIVYPHALIIIQGNTSEDHNIGKYGVTNVSFIICNMTLVSSVPTASHVPSLLWCSSSAVCNSSLTFSSNEFQFGPERSVIAFHNDASLLSSSIHLQDLTAGQMNASAVFLGGNVTDTTVMVACADVQTALTSVLTLHGIATQAKLEFHSVAIHHSNSFGSLINISHSLSTSNTIRLIHTSAKVPVVIASAAGAAGVSGGIMTACSSVGTTPMSEGSFVPELVPLVSVNRGICDAAMHPSCWKTITRSTSSSESPSTSSSPTASTTSRVSATSSRTLSTMLSATNSLRSEVTASLSQTLTTSQGSHSQSSVTLSPPTATRTFILSVTPSTTVSFSKSYTPTSTQRTPSQSTATVQISLTQTPKYCACLGDMNSYGNVVLTDANSSLLVGNTSSLTNQSFEFNSVALIVPQSTNFSEANTVALSTFVTTAPVSRLTVWSSGALVFGLGLLSQGLNPRTDDPTLNGTTTETLCWQPKTVSLRGEVLPMIASRSPPPRETDTVSWSLLIGTIHTDTAPTWVPSSLGPYVDVTLIMEVQFGCAAGDPEQDGGVTLVDQTVPVYVHIAGLPQPLTKEVQAAATASQVLSALASTGGGAAVGRVMAARTVVLCSSGTVAATSSGGPLGLIVAYPVCDEDVAAPIYRGTIIGNLVLLVAVCTAVIAFAAYISYNRRWPMVASLRHIAFPSCLQPVWVVVLPSTATATAQLAAIAPGCVGDIFCILAGIVVVLGPTVALGLLYRWAPATPAKVPAHHGKGIVALFKSIVHPTWTWVLTEDQSDSPQTDHTAHTLEEMTNKRDKGAAEDVNARGRSVALDPYHPPKEIAKDHYLRNAMVILREYTYLSYAVMDASVLIVVGVLVAVSGHGSAAQCTTAAILTAVCYLTQILICAVVRPFTTMFSVGHSLFTLSFTLLSAVLQLVMFALPGNNSHATLLVRLSLAASLCDLIIVGVSYVRTLLDGHELAVFLLAALRRHRKKKHVKSATTENVKDLDEEEGSESSAESKGMPCTPQGAVSTNFLPVLPLGIHNEHEDDSAAEINGSIDFDLLFPQRSNAAFTAVAMIEQQFWDVDGKALFSLPASRTGNHHHDTSMALRGSNSWSRLDFNEDVTL